MLMNFSEKINNSKYNMPLKRGKERKKESLLNSQSTRDRRWCEYMFRFKINSRKHREFICKLFLRLPEIWFRFQEFTQQSLSLACLLANKFDGKVLLWKVPKKKNARACLSCQKDNCTMRNCCTLCAQIILMYITQCKTHH